MALDEVLDAYDRAWNEPETNARRRLLETALADGCEMIEPRGRFVGREAILERLKGFSDRFPGARVEVTTNVDDHNDFARYGWAILDPHGATLLKGIDVVQRGPDNRLRRIVMFFGELHPV